jgi:predicted regulator of Ras-like GTPase activity (Roadblock/LC7/MglB family)
MSLDEFREISPTNISERLQIAIKTAKGGDKYTARRMLLDIVEADPSQEQVWLWLAGLAEDLEEAQTYLETVLALNPEHERAKAGLEIVNQRLEAQGGAQSQSPASSQPSPQASPSPPPSRTRTATEPAVAGGAEPQNLCESCGNPMPSDQPFCPTCGHVPGKSVADEVAELSSMPDTPASRPDAVDVSAEISPSFTLSIEQAEAIDDCLERMAYESEASCIILADVTGQLVSERGKTGGINTQVLSALAAGELSATQEMARLVGERARFSLLLHEGEERSVYLSPVGQKMLLIVVFDGRTPIGLVRIILKNAVDELGPILERPTTRRPGESFGEALNEDFAQQLESEIDASLDLFGG